VLPSPSDLDRERELLGRAQRGDRAALGELLTRYGPVLYRSVLLPRLGDPVAAEQALADTYARVVERIGQLVWQPCGVYPWLRVVALRIALDLLRRRRRELLFEASDLERELETAQADLDASSSSSEEALRERDLEESRRKIDAALGRINPRYAEAIRLRVLEERTREEVASLLGVSVSTFDVVLHRAMTALRKVLGPAEERGQSGD
jgi:RNA polymerase sigma-70 factor (ECF subfamily)